MEFKVRKESQSLLDKTFHRHAKNGFVPKDKVLEMLKHLSPQIVVEPRELTGLVEAYGQEGTGDIDLGSFNKIALHFLLRVAKHESDPFIHKHEIHNDDFAGAPQIAE